RLRRFVAPVNERPMRVDVGDAIAAALRVARIETRERAEVVVRAGKDLAVRARGGEIEHVLLNLLVNPAQALAGVGGLQPPITRTASAVGDDVLIEVEDTGPGLAPEHLERIFDEGFTTKKGRPGSGLGLGLCREIVGKLGGTIEVHAAPGRGTRI